MLSVLILVAELTLIAGIIFSIKYTLSYRSGLNDPDELERIWSRSLEIRYQPVHRSLLLALCVSIGAPIDFITTLMMALSLVGSPAGLTSLIAIVLGFIAVFVGITIGPIVYRASGGTHKWLAAAVILVGNVVNMYMLIGTVVGSVTSDPSFDVDPKLLMTLLAVIPLIILVVQTPLVLWGPAFKLPDAARETQVRTASPMNSIGTGRNIALSAAPLCLVSAFVSFFTPQLDRSLYINRVITGLAGITLLLLSGFASILSVNRAILSEDLRWQWRSFLTPAVPLVVGDIFRYVLRMQRSDGSPYIFMTLPASLCAYGSMGYLSAHLYLYWASGRANEAAS